MSFTVHTPSTAPAAARDALAKAAAAFGFLPNLLGVLAESPPLLLAYRDLDALFDQTSLTPTERQVVLLAVSSENDCQYCVAAHTAIAGMQKVPVDVIEAIRAGRPIADPRLEALRRFTASVVVMRGKQSADVASDFLSAGFTRAQALEVVLGIGLKTLSNYANEIADTPLDQAFAKAAWSKAA